VLEQYLRGFQAVGPTGGYRTAAKPIEPSSDGVRGRGAWEAEVRYLMCPMCTRPMTRQNFARRSGILVDVCPPHGTWFDAGESRAVAEWVAQGGQIAEPKTPVTRPKVDIIALLRR
jgi:Zn-finger nucleic acid-binding protein